MGNSFGPHIGHSDKKAPLPPGNGAGQIGRRRVRFADGEVALVAAALAAKTLGIGDTEIEGCAFVLAGVRKIDADAMCACGYVERNLKIGFVLRAGHITFEDNVGWRVLS